MAATVAIAAQAGRGGRGLALALTPSGARGAASSSSSSSMLNPASTLSADELVEICDENNVPTTPQRRAVMRKERLIHRATYAFVKDSDNYFYVQKRSLLKDYCPGFFDPTPGGVVAAGSRSTGPVACINTVMFIPPAWSVACTKRTLSSTAPPSGSWHSVLSGR